MVERSFGVLKKRFYALGTILRVRDMVLASKLIECGCILHNLSIKHGFSGEELLEDDQPQEEVQGRGQEEGPESEQGSQDFQRERCRNELLAFFQ